MRRRRLFWQILPAFLLVAALAVACFGWSGSWGKGPLYFDLMQRDRETPTRAEAIEGAIRAARWRFAGSAAGVVLAAIVVSLYVARRMRQPLDEISRAARRFAHRELHVKLPAWDSSELAEVSESLNDMARRLEERITTIVRQTNEQRAVLASMAECVIAVDKNERVLNLNRAAEVLLDCRQEDVRGRTLQEVIRNTDLQRFVGHALTQREPIEADVVLHGERQRVLEAHGSALCDEGGQAVGAVVVLNDVTRVRQVDRIRRDFVANVSHELKTPITSIKGFVETLADGALDHRDDARRFLQIVAKEADRLDAIIEDLLSLAKIEQSEEVGDIELPETNLRGVLDSAVEEIASRAAERNISILVRCDEGARARVNPQLFEQAIVNLLDNAVKYSEHGGTVCVEASRNEKGFYVAVVDEGCGIEAKYLDRLFERFYRVDKARSRKQGGTGLGLSIVKHIMQVHGGQVTVESAPGSGSTFTLHLPHKGP